MKMMLIIFGVDTVHMREIEMQEQIRLK
jgi:hypothetical protein